MDINKINQKFTPLSEVKLSQEDKFEVLSNLRREMSMDPFQRDRRRKSKRMSPWTTGGAAATGGALVAGAALVVGLVVANQYGVIQFPHTHEIYGRKQTQATSQPSRVEHWGIANNKNTLFGSSLTITKSQPISMQYLMSIQMINVSDGWAWGDSTSNFALDRTIDGGHTWTKVALPAFPSSGPAMRVPDNIHPYFFNADFGLLTWVNPTNSDLTVLRTTDGGQHWSESHSKVFTDVQEVANVQFIDPSQGWMVAVASPGAGNIGKYLYKTDDGGKTWNLTAARQQGLPSVGTMTNLKFVSALEGWLAIGNSAAVDIELYHTVDGGKSWANIGKSLQIPTGYQNITVNSVYAPVFSGSNNQQGTFVARLSGTHNGSFQSIPTVYTTKDGGQSWTPHVMNGFAQASVNNFGEPAVFLDAQTGWSVQQGTLYRTTTGGQSWEPIVSSTLSKAIASYSAVSNLVFVTKDISWILLEQPGNNRSVLLKTTDGGSTWAYQTKST